MVDAVWVGSVRLVDLLQRFAPLSGVGRSPDPLWQLHDLAARGYGVSVTATPTHAGCVVWDDCGCCVVDVDAATPEAALDEAWWRMVDA